MIIEHTANSTGDWSTVQKLSVQVENIRSGTDTAYKDSGHATIFHSLLESNLPDPEKGRDRLRDEGFNLIAAGSLTTWVLREISEDRWRDDDSAQRTLLQKYDIPHHGESTCPDEVARRTQDRHAQFSRSCGAHKIGKTTIPDGRYSRRPPRRSWRLASPPAGFSS